MMRSLVMALATAGILAGCSGDDDILFDGQAFRAKLSRVKDTPRQFSVDVSPVSASLEGAAAAGEYEAIKYCVQEYGTSDIAWNVGPDTDPATIPLDGDTWTFAGTCTP